MIKLRQKVKDKVSGATGIVTARCEYLNGCVQYCVTPKGKANGDKFPISQYIDQEQLVVVSKGVCIKSEQTGGSMPNTPNTSYQG